MLREQEYRGHEEPSSSTPPDPPGTPPDPRGTPPDPPSTPPDPPSTPADSLGSLGTSPTPETPSLITSQTDIKQAATILLESIVSFVQSPQEQIRTPSRFRINGGRLFQTLFEELLSNFENADALRIIKTPLQPYDSSKASVVFPLSIGNKMMVVKYTSDNLQAEYDLLEQLHDRYLVKLLANPGRVQFANFNPSRFYIGIYPKSETMDEFFDSHVSKSMPEKEAILRSFMAGLFTAINYLHRNDIVHRDIKPGNLGFETIDEKIFVVKLMDFGMSSRLNLAKGVEGSVGYISPAMIQLMGGSSDADQYDTEFMRKRHKFASKQANPRVYKAQDLFAASVSMAFVIQQFLSETDGASPKRTRRDASYNSILQQSYDLGFMTFETQPEIDALDRVKLEIDGIDHTIPTISLVVGSNLQQHLTILIKNQED